MGVCSDSKIRKKNQELLDNNSDIHSIDSYSNKVIRSVCKIEYPKGAGTEKGTGFFIKLVRGNSPLF